MSGDNDDFDRSAAEIELLLELVQRRSITPDDAGCQQLIAARLERAGFTCESMTFGDVTNLWARRGDSQPLFCFAGHTDVVPPGDEGDWDTDPFDPDTDGDGRIECRAWIGGRDEATDAIV